MEVLPKSPTELAQPIYHDQPGEKAKARLKGKSLLEVNQQYM
jgi:hypothetical protein